MSRSRDPLATSRPRDPLALAVPLLVVLYLAGAVWAAADAITPIGPALLDGSVLNAPLIIVAAQVLGALGLMRASGRVRTAAGALIGLACTASLAAFLADGDFAHAGLTAPQV